MMTGFITNTNADSFFKIICSKTLLTTTLPHHNDLNEIDFSSFYRIGNIIEGTKVQEYLKYLYSTTSLSKNYEVKFKDNSSKIAHGCCIPPMWAHYADNVTGVCLCLSKDSLIKENPDFKIEPIDYIIDTKDYESEVSTAEEFIQVNYNKLFLQKDPMWEYEHEVRALVLNETKYLQKPLSIANSVKAVVFSQDFISRRFNEFLSIVSTQDTAVSEIHHINWLRLIRNNVGYSLGTIGADVVDIIEKYEKHFDSYVRFMNSPEKSINS